MNQDADDEEMHTMDSTGTLSGSTAVNSAIRNVFQRHRATSLLRRNASILPPRRQESIADEEVPAASTAPNSVNSATLNISQRHMAPSFTRRPSLSKFPPRRQSIAEEEVPVAVSVPQPVALPVPWRILMFNKIFNPFTEGAMNVLLLVNFGCLLATDVFNPSTPTQKAIYVINVFIGVIIVLEVTGKVVLGQRYYMKKSWSYFEIGSAVFAVIGMARQAGGLNVIRMFRMLNMVQEIPTLRLFHELLNGIVMALPKLRNNVLFLIFFMGLIASGATEFFQCSYDNRCVHENFLVDKNISLSAASCACDTTYHARYEDAVPYVMVPEIACRISIPPTPDNHGCVSTSAYGLCPAHFQCLRLNEAADGGYTGFDNFVLSSVAIFRMMSMSDWAIFYVRLARSEGYMVSAIFTAIVLLFLNFTVLNIFVATLSAMLKDVRGDERTEDSDVHLSLGSTFRHIGSSPMILVQRSLQLQNEANQEPRSATAASTPPKQPRPPRDVSAQLELEGVLHSVEKSSPLYHLMRRNMKTVAPVKTVKGTVMVKIRTWTQSMWFELASCFLIFYSIVVMSSIADDNTDAQRAIINYSEVVCNVLFTLEALIRIVAAHPHYKAYFMRADNILDIVVISSAWVSSAFNLSSLTFLRSFRVIRTLRFASIFKDMADLVAHCISSIIPILNLVGLVSVMICFFGIVGYSLFGGQMGIHAARENQRPNETKLEVVHSRERENFDTVMRSMLTLFQVMTGEDWDKIMINFTKELHWVAPVYFISFYFLAAFIFVNLFTALILESFEMSDVKKCDAQEAIFVTIFKKADRVKEYVQGTIMVWFHSRLPNWVLEDRAEFYNNEVEQRRLRGEEGTVHKRRVSAKRTLNQHVSLKFSVEPTPFMQLLKKVHHNDDKLFFGSFVNETVATVKHGIAEAIQRDIETCGAGVEVAVQSTLGPSPRSRTTHAPGDAGGPSCGEVYANDVDRWIHRVVTLMMQSKRAEDKTTFGGISIPKKKVYNLDYYDPCCADDMGYSLVIFGPKNRLRVFLKWILATKAYTIGIVSVIILSTFVLIMEDPHEADIALELAKEQASWQHVTDIAVLFIFCAEAGIKIFAKGLLFHPNAYLMDAWNIFDFVLLCGMVPSFLQDDNQNLRALRVLRAVRPIRMLQEIPGVARLAGALWNAKWQMINVLVFSFFIIFCFGIFGMFVFSGRLERCNTYVTRPLFTYFPTVKYSTECVGMWVHGEGSLGFVSPMAWNRPIRHFDTAPQAFVALIEVASLSSWKVLMYNSQDITELGRQPIPYNRSIYAMFYVVFIVVAYYLVNLTVGVIIQQIGDARGISLLTDKQVGWSNEQRVILRQVVPIYNPIRGDLTQPWIYRDILQNNSKIDILVSIVIIANVFVLMSIRRGNWGIPWWPRFVDVMNTIFLVFYFAEITIKIKVLGWRTFIGSHWGKFDVVLLTLCVCSTPVEYMSIHKGDSEAIRMLSVAARMLRLAQALKLITKVPYFRWLADTLRITVLDVLRVFVMCLVVVAIAVIIGRTYYTHTRAYGPPGGWEDGSAVTRDFSFRSYTGAIAIVMRCLTLDGWDSFMRAYVIDKDSGWCTKDAFMNDCGSRSAYTYFISLFVIGGWVFLNLLVAIIVDGFAFIGSDFPGVSQQELDEFGIVWSSHDRMRTGSLRPHAVRNVLMDLKKRYPDNCLNCVTKYDMRSLMTVIQLAGTSDVSWDIQWSPSSMMPDALTNLTNLAGSYTGLYSSGTLANPLLSPEGGSSEKRPKTKIEFTNVLLFLTQHSLPDECLSMDEQFYRLHLYFSLDQYLCVTMIQTLFRLRCVRLRNMSSTEDKDEKNNIRRLGSTMANFAAMSGTSRGMSPRSSRLGRTRQAYEDVTL